MMAPHYSSFRAYVAANAVCIHVLIGAVITAARLQRAPVVSVDALVDLAVGVIAASLVPGALQQATADYVAQFTRWCVALASLWAILAQRLKAHWGITP